MAMASLPSSPPPPSPPSISASHSESTVAVATSLVPQMPQVDATAQNGTLNVDDQKLQIANHFALTIFFSGEVNWFSIIWKTLRSTRNLRLMAKYFSKNFYGGNVFDEKTRIDSETILSSRWPCTRSFADPVNAFVDPSNGGANSEGLN
ncbi:hypothetical protein V6N13_099529 [Hibiscus sabdariffa]|uniref:Uncharacterized protein n=1 Tax=Hibiscus sabdariffa TaxID=183260 RepID=A0ABR2PZW8_9ROSI